MTEVRFGVNTSAEGVLGGAAVDELKTGDRIRVRFEGSQIPAKVFTICAALSDQQEGLGPEIADYVACWLEVSQGDCANLAGRHAIDLGTDFKYMMDGQYVIIEKIT